VGLYKFEEYGWFWNRRGKDVENHDSLLLIYTFEKRALKLNIERLTQNYQKFLRVPFRVLLKREKLEVRYS